MNGRAMWLAGIWFVWGFVWVLLGEEKAFCGQGQPAQEISSQEKPSIDLFSLETDYVGKSQVRELNGRFGSQDVLSEHFSYGHRFLIQGNWYLLAGVEYQRYDIGGAKSPLPSQFQSLSGVIALEYVIHNQAGAAIAIHPGYYGAGDLFRDECLDVPVEAYSGFTIIKGRLYGTLGVSCAQFYSIPVIPIAGVIWLLNDDLRLEALFPRSSLVYTPHPNWELDLIYDLYGGGYRAAETGDSRNRDRHLGNSVFQYYENRIAAQVTYSGWKPCKLTLGGGWVFGRTYDYFRADTSFTTDGAPFLKAAITVDF